MITAWVPVVALIAGLLIWVLASHTIVKDAGRITFACGMLVTLASVGHQTVALLGGR